MHKDSEGDSRPSCAGSGASVVWADPSESSRVEQSDNKR